MTDRAVAEVKDFLAGDRFEPRIPQEIDRTRVGQWRTILCRVIERLVYRYRVERLATNLVQRLELGFGEIVLLRLIRIDRARRNGRQLNGYLQEIATGP